MSELGSWNTVRSFAVFTLQYHLKKVIGDGGYTPMHETVDCEITENATEIAVLLQRPKLSSPSDRMPPCHWVEEEYQRVKHTGCSVCYISRCSLLWVRNCKRPYISVDHSLSMQGLVDSVSVTITK